LPEFNNIRERANFAAVYEDNEEDTQRKITNVQVKVSPQK